MNRITTLIFDFDGVFTTDEYRQMRRLCPDESLLEKIEIPYYTLPHSDNLWSDQRAQFHFSESDQECIDIYNQEDPDQITHKNRLLAYAKTLSKHFSLVLLSNQVNDRTQYLRKTTDLAFFKHTYFSSEIALKKPDKEIFQWVLATLHLTAEECAFIDDSPANTDTANNLGIISHTFIDLAGLEKFIDSIKS